MTSFGDRFAVGSIDGMSTWFEALFGFVESSYSESQARFAVNGTTLRSHVNGREFGIGSFTTPTLESLREEARGKRSGTLRVTHEVVGDALELHARPENRGALFQVASQFNCLEFVGPSVTPEDGVTGYAHDPTQGPACALAAAAATVYRNYFAPVRGLPGQTADRQINNLDALADRLDGVWFEVRNGYTFSSEPSLQAFDQALLEHDREALLGAVKIGLQRGVEVTFARRFVEPTERTWVSQAFCSALSCGYTSIPLERWTAFATLALDAAYEATLLAAIVDAEATGGSGKVWLTLLGGGAFGNRRSWIGRAIGRALTRCADRDLDVRIAHYRDIDRAMQTEIDAARGVS